MRNPPFAKTLRWIGRDGRQGFYMGPVMQDIVERPQALGGLHEKADFAAHHSDWVGPIFAPYRAFDVYECPPNGHGLTALMILRIPERYPPWEAMNSARQTVCTFWPRRRGLLILCATR